MGLPGDVEIMPSNMRKAALPMAAALAVALILPWAAQAQMLGHGMLARGLMRNRQAMGTLAPPAPPHQTLAYGNGQSYDFYPPQHSTGPAPLVLFVHGGAWSRGSKDTATGPWKAPHYTGEGYAFASMDYRLVPKARVEDQAADVAHALHAILRDADRLGVDRRRIVLMGHSAGAQLVALVGTDESYLKAEGLSLAEVAGVIPIDGAAYNIPEQMKTSGEYMGARYDQAFGTDPARQRALSATLHADAPNAPRFLLLHVQRPDGIAQAQELAEALRSAGTPVEIKGFPGTGLMGHLAINQRLGDPTYEVTPIVDEWLKKVFGK